MIEQEDEIVRNLFREREEGPSPTCQSQFSMHNECGQFVLATMQSHRPTSYQAACAIPTCTYTKLLLFNGANEKRQP